MPPDPKAGQRPSRRRLERTAREASRALEWNRLATALGCRVCGPLGEECEGVVQGHHVLRRALIREHVNAYAAEHHLTRRERADLLCDLSWDHDNALGVCYRTHRRHHSRVQPIPMLLVPARAMRFAERLGLAHRLEAEYPSETVG